jgi:hypothetical protein
VLGDIDALEAAERAHADVVEMREQEGVDEVAAVDGELGVVDGLLGDLEARRTRTEEAAAAAPVELHFRFARAGDEIRQVEAEEVVAFDDVGVALFDQGR